MRLLYGMDLSVETWRGHESEYVVGTSSSGYYSSKKDSEARRKEVLRKVLPIFDSTHLVHVVDDGNKYVVSHPLDDPSCICDINNGTCYCWGCESNSCSHIDSLRKHASLDPVKVPESDLRELLAKILLLEKEVFGVLHMSEVILDSDEETDLIF